MSCPYCESEHVIKAGKRKNKYVTKQGYRCKSCKRWFIERDGFEGMTFPKEIIVEALHLYVEGLSLGKIKEHMCQHHGYVIYESRILDWVRKYANVVKKLERTTKPVVRGRVHVDEVVLKVRKKRCYGINAIDSETKFNLGSEFTKNKGLETFKGFFSRLKERIGEQVHKVFDRERYKPLRERRLITFVSDKLGQIRRAFNIFFYRIAKLVHGVPIACKRFGLEHNNNPIERHNEDIKQRYKVMRHFKSFASAEAFLTLRRAIYNFVRGHSSLSKRTPAEVAGVELGLGKNRLLCLISFCSRPP